MNTVHFLQVLNIKYKKYLCLLLLISYDYTFVMGELMKKSFGIINWQLANTHRKTHLKLTGLMYFM